jgi:uncharacterized membrane protein YhaH (DUF805 family)
MKRSKDTARGGEGDMFKSNLCVCIYYHLQWICLPSAVDVVGKHRTIQFTVTCVMIIIVQKAVILRNMQDRGRSIDWLLLIFNITTPAAKDMNLFSENPQKDILKFLNKIYYYFYFTLILN